MEGHTIEECRDLKDKIQQLIDAKVICLEDFATKRVQMRTYQSLLEPISEYGLHHLSSYFPHANTHNNMWTIKLGELYHLVIAQEGSFNVSLMPFVIWNYVRLDSHLRGDTQAIL